MHWHKYSQFCPGCSGEHSLRLTGKEAPSAFFFKCPETDRSHMVQASVSEWSRHGIINLASISAQPVGSASMSISPEPKPRKRTKAVECKKLRNLRQKPRTRKKPEKQRKNSD